MTPGDESSLVAYWAQDRLASSVAVLEAMTSLASDPQAPAVPVNMEWRIWTDRVPENGAPLPALILSTSDTTDTARIGAQDRFLTAVPLSVKVMMKGHSSMGSGPLLRAMYAALQGNHNYVQPLPDDPDEEPATILTSERVGTFRYPETVDGVGYLHIGANFSVTIQ